ncbi:MAG TPA: DUF6600 domain-containing protein, partial [Myxococcota bacterium]
MRSASLVALVAALGTLATGCVTRTVYVVRDAPAPAARAAAPVEPRDDAPPAVADVGPNVGPEAAPADVGAPERAEPIASPNESPEDSGGVARVDDFYEPLAPYGQWVDYPGYGRVFVPARDVVGAGFRPYTYGHWEYSEYGWTWVDHHPFGWATGHYGRWFYDGSYGWVWVPGTTWAPAWVTWRSGGSYVGWAPIPPGGEFGSAYTVYDSSWVFVGAGVLGAAYIGSAIIVGPRYHDCFVATYPERETSVYYGRTYYRGPRQDYVERNGGHVVHRSVREADASDHPVTHAPTGTSKGRGNASSSPSSSGRPRHDASARPDAAGPSSSPRGSARDDDDGHGSASSRDDGHGSGRDASGRDASGRDASGRAASGRDDGRAGADAARSDDRDDHDPARRVPSVPGRADPRDPAPDAARPLDPRDDARDPRTLPSPSRTLPSTSRSPSDPRTLPSTSRSPSARPDSDDLDPNRGGRTLDVTPRTDVAQPRFDDPRAPVTRAPFGPGTSASP